MDGDNMMLMNDCAATTEFRLGNRESRQRYKDFLQRIPRADRNDGDSESSFVTCEVVSKCITGRLTELHYVRNSGILNSRNVRSALLV